MDDRLNKKVLITISLLTVVAGIIVMMGWEFNFKALESIVPGFEAMRFNAALCFVLLGLALLLTRFKNSPANATAFFLFALLGTTIGLITFLQDLLHFNSGLDQLFVTDRAIPSYSIPFPGRMAFNASVNFFLLGAGLLTVKVKRRSWVFFSQVNFHLVTILSTIALIGYLYGVSFFRVFLYRTSMATHTALLFFILSIGASLLNPEIGITSLFTGKQVGNEMAKRLFGLMLLMVIIFGSLRMQTQRFGMFSSVNLGISILAVCFLLVSLLLIWNTANWLNNIDKKRSEAEDEVRRMNAGLEKMVQERSAEYQKSEEKYRSLIEQASDAIYVIDYKGNIIDANASMCNMVGYAHDELLTTNVTSLLDPEELKIEPLADRLITLKDASMRERKYMRKNGEVFPVEINLKKFADDRIMIIARDITGRKKMEMELREAELKFRTIADKSMVGVYIAQNDRFTYVNPRFAAVFGYTPEELTNTVPLETVFHESFRPVARENIRKRIAGEVDSVHYEALGRKKDGTPNWVEFYGSRAIIGGEPAIMGSMIDITERKQAEEELKKSEANLQTILKTTDTAYALFDPDLTVLAFNPKAEVFVREQYQHIPAKGDKLSDYFPMARFPKFAEYARKVLNGQNFSYEIDYPQSDRSKCWYFVRLFPITNDNKEILGLMMALYDITERKNAEQHLKDAYSRIQAHIDSIKDMAWKQSHLIRSPLANLKGLTAILKEHPAETTLFEHIEKELDRMDSILLEMAREASHHD